MNPIIRKHFETVESWLLRSSVISSYQILRQEIAATDGKLRIKALLIDAGIVELFEYISESEGQIELIKYSFHWQDTQANLKRRWDNAPHCPNLSNAPHHVHKADGSASGNLGVPDILSVLEEIETVLNQAR